MKTVEIEQTTKSVSGMRKVPSVYFSANIRA